VALLAEHLGNALCSFVMLAALMCPTVKHAVPCCCIYRDCVPQSVTSLIGDMHVVAWPMKGAYRDNMAVVAKLLGMTIPTVFAMLVSWVRRLASPSNVHRLHTLSLPGMMNLSPRDLHSCYFLHLPEIPRKSDRFFMPVFPLQNTLHMSYSSGLHSTWETKLRTSQSGMPMDRRSVALR
jgi:hypothetical protein